MLACGRSARASRSAPPISVPDGETVARTDPDCARSSGLHSMAASAPNDTRPRRSPGCIVDFSASMRESACCCARKGMLADRSSATTVVTGASPAVPTGRLAARIARSAVAARHAMRAPTGSAVASCSRPTTSTAAPARPSAPRVCESHHAPCMRRRHSSAISASASSISQPPPRSGRGGGQNAASARSRAHSLRRREVGFGDNVRIDGNQALRRVHMDAILTRGHPCRGPRPAPGARTSRAPAIGTGHDDRTAAGRRLRGVKASGSPAVISGRHRLLRGEPGDGIGHEHRKGRAQHEVRCREIEMDVDATLTVAVERRYGGGPPTRARPPRGCRSRFDGPTVAPDRRARGLPPAGERSSRP